VYTDSARGHDDRRRWSAVRLASADSMPQNDPCTQPVRHP